MTQNYTSKKQRNQNEILPSKKSIDFILNFSKSYKVLKNSRLNKTIEFYSN